MLEPDDGKLSSPVLRGRSGRKTGELPGIMGKIKEKNEWRKNCEEV